MELNFNLLKNKVVLLTGCNRGIGKCILEKFASQQAIVYAVARQNGVLDEIATTLSERYSTKVFPIYFDVRDTPAIKNLIQKINKEQRRLDCVVNNAGVMNDALLGMISEEAINETFSVNVFAPLNIIQYATRLMKKQNFGSIINISSIVGIQGSPGQVVYSSSKGAIISLTKSAAKELAPFNIRVNAIAPGMVNTDLIRTLGENKIAENISNIAMGRLGSPEDIANAALFLASDLSTYISGQILGVDGVASLK